MFDAYKVAVKLSLVNHVSTGLLAIAGQMSVLHRSSMQVQGSLTGIEQKLHKIKTLGLIGGGLAAVGFGSLSLLKGPYEEAKKLAQAKANFETLNLSSGENQEAFAKAAAQSQKILGTNITENVKAIHDLHTAFGDLHHAIGSADTFAKFSFVAKIMNGGKPVEGLVYSAAKALEHRGGKVMNDNLAFQSELDLMQRVYLGSRGKVNPNEFFHASQTGKLAYTLMSKEELYGPFAAFMQAKTGTTAGTAQMTFASSFIGGHMTNKAKGFLADLGLWQEGASKKRLEIMQDITKSMSPEQRKSMGMLTPTSGGLKDEYVGLAVGSTSKFVQDVLVPAIRKKYGMDMSDEKMATMLMSNFNRNTSDVMGEYIVNALKFRKDTAIFNSSKGGDSAYEHYLKSPLGAEEASAEAWRNLTTVIGSVYLPKITQGLLSLAGSLTKLSGWLDAHPNLTKTLVWGFTALAGAMAFGGTVLLLTAGVKGLGLAFGLLRSPLVGLITGGSSFGAIGTALGLLASPIGIAVLAIGTIAAACYAFRPLTQREIDAVKTDGGARLTASAQARLITEKDRLAALDKDFKRRDAGLIQSIPSFIAKKQVTTVGAAPSNAPLAFKVENKFDMHGLTTKITQMQAKSIAGPQVGSSQFDDFMNMRLVGSGASGG
ncbi:MAG: hypothetical protein K2Y28_10795 [Burkholderiaceae bacterium]|nr:hypothetical protein [Burkholderiaceae bacterium]